MKGNRALIVKTLLSNDERASGVSQLKATEKNIEYIRGCWSGLLIHLTIHPGTGARILWGVRANIGPRELDAGSVFEHASGELRFVRSRD